jgi:hypothetical protein
VKPEVEDMAYAQKNISNSNNPKEKRLLYLPATAERKRT